MLAAPALGALEGEDVVAGEGRGHAGEGRAGVLVHLEVLAAGVLRDLLQPDLEGVPGGLGDVQAEDGRAGPVEGGAGGVVVVVEDHGAAAQLAEAVAEEEDRLRPGDGQEGAAEGQQGLLRRGGSPGLLAVEVGGERGRGRRGDGARPAEEDRLVQDAVGPRSRSAVKSRCSRRWESKVSTATRSRGESGARSSLACPMARSSPRRRLPSKSFWKRRTTRRPGESGRSSRRGAAREHAGHVRRLRHPHRRLQRGARRPSTSSRKSAGREAGQGPAARSR